MLSHKLGEPRLAPFLTHEIAQRSLQGESQMHEMVTISKDEYLRLKAIEEDMADLNSAADVLARIKAGT